MSRIDLETSRLRIRPFIATDLHGLARLMDDCFGPAPLEVRSAWLDWTIRNYVALAKLFQPPYGEYAVVTKANEELIGAVGLLPCFAPFDTLPVFRSMLRVESAGHFQAEMGLFWAVRSEHRRKGYAAEAAAAMVRFAFEKLKAHRIVATTEHDNAASIATMRKIGMTVERNPRTVPEWFQTVGVLFNSEGPD